MTFENNKATYETPAIDIYDFQIESIMDDSVIIDADCGDNDGPWQTGWNEYEDNY